jgi:hypothetical protein
MAGGRVLGSRNQTRSKSNQTLPKAWNYLEFNKKFGDFWNYYLISKNPETMF